MGVVEEEMELIHQHQDLLVVLVVVDLMHHQPCLDLDRQDLVDQLLVLLLLLPFSQMETQQTLLQLDGVMLVEMEPIIQIEVQVVAAAVVLDNLDQVVLTEVLDFVQILQVQTTQ